ncbi:hypothetical protein N8991_03540 [Schleiferiaceae bacterium]|nr:hypothetical protein [Schleiferiaceae bacterium]
MIRIPANFLLQFFYARLLGPANFGVFDYVLNASNKIIAFFDGGSSKAFFVKLSEDNQTSIYSLYFFLLSLFLLTLNVVFLVVFQVLPAFFPGNSLVEVLLITNLASVLYFLSAVYNSLDAVNRTVYLEKVKIALIVFTLTAFFIVYLTIENFGITKFVSLHLFINVMALIFVSYKQKIFKRIYRNLASSICKENFIYLASFVKPLLVYSFVTTLIPIFERWLLHFFNDSVELGYFAIAFKLAALVLVFTSAFIPLFGRQLSILNSLNKTSEIAHLYLSTQKRLLVLTGSFSILVANFSQELISAVGGNVYKEATPVLHVMSFYPVAQTLWQINGSYFYSTKRVSTYSNIGIVTSPISFLLIWVFIAPKDLFGMNLGALGLALTYILYTFSVVQIQQYYISKHVGLSWKTLAGFQITVLAFLFSINHVTQIYVTIGFLPQFGQKLFSSLLFVVIVFLLVIKRSNFFLNISLMEIKKIVKNRLWK